MKKRFTNIILSILMAIVCFLPLGTVNEQKASAYSSAYNGEDNTIYYFTDLFPTIDANDWAVTDDGYDFSNYNIVFDQKKSCASIFNDTNSVKAYFSGFGANCAVILDFKLYKPNPAVLNYLFNHLKSFPQNCYTGLITRFSQTELLGLNMSYIDLSIFNVDCTMMKGFFDWGLTDYRTSKNPANTYNGTVFVLDKDIVNCTSEIDTLEDLLEEYPFFGMFLEVLEEKIEDEMLTLELPAGEEYNVSVAVQIGDAVFDFKDLLNGFLLEGDSIYTLLYNDANDFDYACAFGFWQLSSNFYDFIWDTQEEQNYDLPVYAYLADPGTYSENGISVFDVEYEDLKAYPAAHGYVPEIPEKIPFLRSLYSLLN
ncbi:MAG: hypothetical protein IJW58_02640 [Clostridia bacterium]|nr:hypothetical protein [Clostridia bacterium]